MKNDPGTMIRELTSTIRTVVDDLLTDLAETENARQAAVSLERSTAADRLDVAALRGALDAPDDADVNQLIDVVHSITEQVEKAEYVSRPLPTPDATNPSHLRWTARMIDAFREMPQGVVSTPAAEMLHAADRLEAAQQQAVVDAPDPDEELVRQVGEACRTTLSNVLGYLGITHVDRTDWAAVARDALQAAGLLQGGDEK